MFRSIGMWPLGLKRSGAWPVPPPPPLYATVYTVCHLFGYYEDMMFVLDQDMPRESCSNLDDTINLNAEVNNNELVYLIFFFSHSATAKPMTIKSSRSRGIGKGMITFLQRESDWGPMHNWLDCLKPLPTVSQAGSTTASDGPSDRVNPP